MQRRDFLKKSISTIATAGVSSALLGTASTFASPSYDWKLGWKSVEQDSFSALNMQIHGHIPKQLNGAFFRNGPAKLARNGVRYQHWFDGDGMIQKFEINNGRVTHTGKYVHTNKYVQEEQAQRFLYNGAGTALANSEPTRNNDSINTANTALQVWDNELLALWEGGSATSVNPNDLSTKGLKTWHEKLANMPFSAHPLIDEKGNMWNFGFAPYAGKTGKIVVYHIAPKEGLKNTQIIDMPFKGYMHDFAQTNESLIFLVPPFTFTKPGGKTFIDGFQWQEQLSSRLLVVNKSDLSQQKWFELPAGFVFHFGHATQQGANLQVNMCWYENGEIMQHDMPKLMATGNLAKSNLAAAATVVANLQTGKATLVKSETNLEFPEFNNSMLNQDSNVFGVNRSKQSSGHADTLMNWSPYQGEIDSYRYPAGVMVEEPILVSAKETSSSNNAHAGYILQTYLDLGSKKQSGVNVFEANNLAAGPIGQASMERTLPLGFHGTFMAA